MRLFISLLFEVKAVNFTIIKSYLLLNQAHDVRKVSEYW